LLRLIANHYSLACDAHINDLAQVSLLARLEGKLIFTVIIAGERDSLYPIFARNDDLVLATISRKRTGGRFDGVKPCAL
jgi:hypothetical protein